VIPMDETAPLFDFPEIDAFDGVTERYFFDEIVPRSRPAVLRGLVAHWPAVAMAKRSLPDFIGYLKGFDAGLSAEILEGPPELKGQFFYNDDMSGFNFRKYRAPVAETLDRILANATPEGRAVYMGSVTIRKHLPVFEARNRCPFDLPDAAPRIWIGGAARIQTHFDPVHNLACCVAGQRRFTVFPPEQVRNLYLGPFELTPAGAAISLARLEAPDFDRFPRFETALAAARTAVLEPGDALYLPHYWFHHVVATEPLNTLVNYWWGEQRKGIDNPRNAFLTALLAIRDLDGDEGVFWKAMLEHYVLRQDGDPVVGIPAALQGAFGEMSEETRSRVRAFTLSLINGDT
jgi:hypothetical protein